jgi:hypothetical protein
MFEEQSLKDGHAVGRGKKTVGVPVIAKVVEAIFRNTATDHGMMPRKSALQRANPGDGQLPI